MAETTGNKRRRLAAPAEVSHEVDASNSLQDPRLLDNSGESPGSPKTVIAAKRKLTPSPPSPTGSLSAGSDNGSEVSYSVDAGNSRTPHTTDIMLGGSSHDVIKCYKTEDEHLLDAINSESPCEAVALLHTRVHSFTPDGLNQALIFACRRGHKLLVQTLVRAGANIEHRDENGNTPLLICAEQGFMDIVRFLVSRYANVNARNSTGNTALILSVRPAGSTDLTMFLLEQQDVDIHHENQDGDTALNRATRFMNVDTMRLLLEKSLARTSGRRGREVHGITHETGTCFFNSRAQEMKQEEIVARAGLVDVYEMLKEHVITGTSPLELAIKARDIKSLDIFLDCQWSSSSDKKTFVDRALVYMFPKSRHEGVKIFSDTEVRMVQRLLQNEADVNQVDGTRLISLAVEVGDFQLVELMCAHGARLTTYYYSEEEDPLCIAAKNGRRDLIELLLTYGADTDRHGFSESPLDYALRNDHTECAKLLIQRGAKMNVACALRSAVEHQRPNYTHFVFENYKHDFMEFFSQQTVDARKLLILAVEKGNTHIIGQILDAGVDVNEADSFGQTPLTAAKNRAVAEFLIHRGADVNHVTECRGSTETPLSYLIKNRKCDDAFKVELCKVLIDNGAMVNNRNRKGKTPLMMAASQDDCVSMLKMLLDNGADVTDKDNKGNTALLHAVKTGSSNNASFLLNFSRNLKSVINIQNNEGLTPLTFSVIKRNDAIMIKLIEEGADVNVKDNNGNTALHHLLINVDGDDFSGYMRPLRSHLDFQNCEVILRSLLKAGGHVNCQNIEGLSPLMLAAKISKPSLMSILLDAGADVNAVCKNNHSQTAISFISVTTNLGNYNIRCIEFLLERGANASYLSHGCLHRLIFDDKIHVVLKLIERGAGPTEIEARKCILIHLQNSLFGLPRTLSPLCFALLCGHISLARIFMDILFLTRSDLSMFASKMAMEWLLLKIDQWESIRVLQELSSQPMTLVSLCLVTVSAVVGSYPGREARVASLPMPQIMKDRLRFKSVDDTHPVLSEIHLEQSTTDKSILLNSFFFP